MSAVLNPPGQVDRPVPPAESRLPRSRRAILFVAPLVLIGLAWAALPAGVFLGLHSDRPALTPAVLGRASEPDGEKLYLYHCSYCHGDRGDGNGVAALNPRARYFGHERFKLAGTTNGIPTDDDLTRVIRHGIQGTAMPGFDERTITSTELEALCGHIRRLTWSGTYTRIRQKTDPDEFDPTECAEKTDAQCRPGTLQPVPGTFPESSPESIARGRKVYEQTCMSCHGPEGKGDGPQVKDPAFKNENGSKANPRDLTSGVFKGGGDPAQLYLRIRLGMPGTPMPASPASTLPDEAAFDLIHYVRSLSAQPN